MPDDTPRVYWDANVLLSYINGVAERVSTINELFRQARAREIELVTSAITRVEVAFATEEKTAGALDPEVEERIDKLWAHGSPVKLVEFYDLIAERARALMRRGISQGWGSLKPLDAIHLATAQQMDVAEFHTYCARLQKWSGRLGFPVYEPQTAQGLLGVEPPEN